MQAAGGGNISYFVKLLLKPNIGSVLCIFISFFSYPLKKQSVEKDRKTKEFAFMLYGSNTTQKKAHGNLTKVYPYYCRIYF